MTRRVRTTAAAIVVSAALALTACSGLPTEGSFRPGLPTDGESSEARWQLSAAGPSEGAEPGAIVLGFLDAGESPQDDWEVAREFLAPEAQATWDPNARITIDSVNDRTVAEFDADDDADDLGHVTARVTPTGTVDATGAYTRMNDTVRSLDFELRRIGGEWRISSAPDGVVVQSGSFTSIFAPHHLIFSSLGDRLVPDVRWFPDSPDRIRRVVTELVEGGPAPWLEDAVYTAFDGVTVRGVRIGDGNATIELSSEAADAGPERRARMQTQLERTLGVGDVRMTVNGTRITAPDDVIVETEPDPRAIALAKTNDGTSFGYFTNDGITPIPGLTEVIAEQFAPGGEADDPATSISVAPNLTYAIVQTESGRMWWVDDDGSYDAFNYSDGWLTPSLDPFGYAWSVKPDKPGLLQTWGADLESRELPGVGELSEISAIQLARDGARIAITGRRDNQPVLVIAGVERDADGAPIGLTEVQDIYPLSEDAGAVAWVSETAVASMMVDDGRTVVREQELGGRGVRLTPSFTATEITYGNPESRERLLAEDGSLYIRSTTSWEQVGSGVLVLATQMGAPPIVDPSP